MLVVPSRVLRLPRVLWALVIPFGPAMTACGADVDGGEARLSEPDRDRFEQEVYPVLLRDCAMSECHGSAERFFRVVGPGRVRLSKHTEPLDLATADEIQLSYNRTRSMLGQTPEVQRPLLLRKPLARSAGGAEHGGEDRYGRNVYASERDPAYSALARWAEAP